MEAETTTALVPVEPSDALATFSAASGGLVRARAIADELRAIVEAKNLKVKIGHGEHLRVEVWLACGALVGMTPRTVWVKRLPEGAGELLGYHARVEVVRLSTGEIVGAAEAGYFTSEQQRDRRTGQMVDRWQDEHAVLSMSQTRATSKALGQVLRWIPVLAGYSGTPAEEMPAEIDVTPARPTPPPPPGFAKSSPGAKESVEPSAGATGGSKAPGTKFITGEQVTDLWIHARRREQDTGVPSETIVRTICTPRKITSTKEIPPPEYGAILDAIDAFDPPAAAQEEETF